MLNPRSAHMLGTLSDSTLESAREILLDASAAKESDQDMNPVEVVQEALL